MTVAEPLKLLDFLHGRVSDRKARLFAVSSRGCWVLDLLLGKT